MIILAPYDSNGRRAGASEGIPTWRNMLGDFPLIENERYLGAIIPHLVEAQILSTARRGDTPLLIGGDHSLTYFAVKALTSHFGPLTVLHFDAHHDAYPQVQLNNFTVFYHIKKRLFSKVVPVGYRYDVSACRPLLNSNIDGNIYLSIDLDFFDPKLVPSVNHPVRSEKSCANERDFLKNLKRIKGHVIGVDIVEWLGALKGAKEYIFVNSIVRTVLERYIFR